MFLYLFHYFHDLILKVFHNARKFVTKIEFKCNVTGCSKTKTNTIENITNLNRHLRTHRELDEWFGKYEEYKNTDKKIISTELLNFIRFMIKSNVAFKTIEEKEIFHILHPNLKLVSYETLTDRMIPALFASLNSFIGQKMQKSISITLISDCWTGQFCNEEYLGLAANLINEAFQIETLVIGMEKLNNGHSAEECKHAIENIINQLKFDKKKIKGK